jgi:iron complex transport system substrate-binding protein
MGKLYVINFIAVLGLCLGLPQCAPPKTENSHAWTTYYKPHHAHGFEILSNANHSIYRILLFNNNGDTIKSWNLEHGKKQRTVCLSTTHLPMFQSVGALDQVVGVAFADLVKNKEVRNAIAQDKIKNISQGEDISKEILLALQPDQFLIYTYGDKDYSFYQQAGIEVIPVSEYLEKTPLARSEWVVLFGVLSGDIQKGIETFQQVEQRYLALKQQTEQLDRPKVITGYYNSGQWYAPPGNSFVAQFIHDAGAEYIWKDSLADANLIIPFETMFASMDECTFWGKLAFTPNDPTREDFAGDVPQITQLKSFAEKQLFFCNTQRTDYFGDAIMEPEIILSDLIKIFHPELLPQHQAKYFQPLP